MRKLLFTFVRSIAVFPLAAGSLPVLSQVLPDLPVPVKGNTVNMSVQAGSKASLSFGSATSFGTSANLSATDGSSSSSISSMTPASGTLKFSIGGGATPGTTTADIGNLRAIGNGSPDFAGTPMNVVEKDATFSTGKATLTGVQGSLEMTLDSTGTSFKAQTGTIHESYGVDAVGGRTGGDGKSITTVTTNVSNASANALINSNTNVDINTSNFTSQFSQAF